MKHYKETKFEFNHNGYELFWLKQKNTYRNLWREVELFIIAFPSTYLVEKGFNAVQQLSTKSKNRLNISEKEELRLTHKSDIILLARHYKPQGCHYSKVICCSDLIANFIFIKLILLVYLRIECIKIKIVQRVLSFSLTKWVIIKMKFFFQFFSEGRDF